MLLLLAILATPLQSPAKPEALMTRLGGFHRSITTKSPEGGRFFDQGLACIYGYQYSTARRSFEQASRLDPDCAINYWGVALSYGPNINEPVVSEEASKKALDALRQADMAKTASSVERELIRAQSLRFASPAPKDRSALDRKYAEAMRTVWVAHQNDPDIGALFAEALIDQKPWSQWTLDGKPEVGTLEALSVLEQVLKLNPKHPMALHLYIHATESSPNPERGLKAANTLMDLQPDLGHMQHMPSHIYVRTGRWKQAVEANLKSIAVGNAYRKSRGIDLASAPNVTHPGEMLAYAAAMRGQSALAIRAVDVKGFSSEWLAKNSVAMDGDLAIPIEVLQRFGKWQAILDAPEFDEKLPISRAMRAGARAVAFAATERIPEAKAEQARFEAIFNSIPPDRTDGQESIRNILEVERRLVAGEILIRDSATEEEGVAKLRSAVEAEDALHYGLPPSWLQPTRHPLGAGLLYLGRYRDAESVFREDLKIHPHNGWALIGLSKALRGQRREREADAALAEFRVAWRDADVPIDTSCLCLKPKS